MGGGVGSPTLCFHFCEYVIRTLTIYFNAILRRWRGHAGNGARGSPMGPQRSEIFSMAGGTEETRARVAILARLAENSRDENGDGFGFDLCGADKRKRPTRWRRPFDALTK